MARDACRSDDLRPRHSGNQRMAEANLPEPIVLNIGITGHRSDALTAPLVRTLRPIVFTVFRQLHEAILRLQQEEATLPSDAGAQLRLHTALATGPDRGDLRAIERTSPARTAPFLAERISQALPKRRRTPRCLPDPQCPGRDS